MPWYRVTPKNAPCDDGWTTGNTASQLQLEFTPQDVVQDRIFCSALLASSQAVTVTVTVGGVNLSAAWTKTPSGSAGISPRQRRFRRQYGRRHRHGRVYGGQQAIYQDELRRHEQIHQLEHLCG